MCTTGDDALYEFLKQKKGDFTVRCYDENGNQIQYKDKNKDWKKVLTVTKGTYTESIFANKKNIQEEEGLSEGRISGLCYKKIHTQIYAYRYVTASPSVLQLRLFNMRLGISIANFDWFSPTAFFTSAERTYNIGDILFLQAGDIISKSEANKKKTTKGTTILPLKRTIHTCASALFNGDRFGVSRFMPYLPSEERLRIYYKLNSHIKSENIQTANVGIITRFIRGVPVPFVVVIKPIYKGDIIGFDPGDTLYYNENRDFYNCPLFYRKKQGTIPVPLQEERDYSITPPKKHIKISSEVTLRLEKYNARTQTLYNKYQNKNNKRDMLYILNRFCILGEELFSHYLETKKDGDTILKIAALNCKRIGRCLLKLGEYKVAVFFIDIKTAIYNLLKLKEKTPADYSKYKKRKSNKTLSSSFLLVIQSQVEMILDLISLFKKDSFKPESQIFISLNNAMKYLIKRNLNRLVNKRK